MLMVRKIVLSIASVLAVFSMALAQNKQVSGTVTGPDGAPVAGAAVVVDGHKLHGVIVGIGENVGGLAANGETGAAGEVIELSRG